MLQLLILSFLSLLCVCKTIHSQVTAPLALNEFCTRSNENDSSYDNSDQILMTFWNKYIHSFKINHGTSSIYLNHFKEHGVNSIYPSILQSLIPKIRKLWDSHEHDIAEKTEAFRNFEQRYDRSRQEQTIALFFSAQSIITREHTVGYSQGGEWVRELKNFLDKASKKAYALSIDERNIITEAQSFVNLVNKSPPLVISLRASSKSFRKLLGKDSLFFPFAGFCNYVKRHCERWDDPFVLSEYLNHRLLPLLEFEKQQIISLYEMKLSDPIPPEELEFEVAENIPNTKIK